MDILKLEYEVQRLQDGVQERARLAGLGVRPSASDDERLRRQIRGVLELLNAVDAGERGVRESIALYNRCLGECEEVGIDTRGCEYIPREREDVQEQEIASPDPGPSKKVRFSEGSEVDTGETLFQPYHDETEAGENPHFQPYHDDEPSLDEPPLDTNRPSGEGLHKALFVEQQQRLMQQDAHIDALHASVQRAHGISLDIDAEVDDQNRQLLPDLEGLVDRGEASLQRAARRLDVFQRTARDNGPCSTIVILIVVLFLLLVLL